LFVRPVNWIRAARKAFDSFPEPVRIQIASDLAIAAAGANTTAVKPLKGFTEGVFEIIANDRSGNLPDRLCSQDPGCSVGRPCLAKEIDNGRQDRPTRH
jgi:hypothetical protein